MPQGNLKVYKFICVVYKTVGSAFVCCEPHFMLYSAISSKVAPKQTPASVVEHQQEMMYTKCICAANSLR